MVFGVRLRVRARVRLELKFELSFNNQPILTHTPTLTLNL